ncbi:phage holin [Cronobacter sakazakii]|nr:phage holin [Cronobacter sakazakii]
MSKLASGAAYGASAGTVANGLLTRLSPDEWSAVGVSQGGWRHDRIRHRGEVFR